jgi:hypothetical protein
MLGSKSGDLRGSSHGDGEPGDMTCPGAPTCHGAAGLRLDGQHTGMVRVPAARLDVAGPALKKTKEGGEKKLAAAVPTLGRRRSRGWLGVDGGVAKMFTTMLVSSAAWMFPLRLGSFPQRGRPPLLSSRWRLCSSPLARRRCSSVAASLLDSTQRRRPLLPPSHGALTGEEERENPNGGWWLGRPGISPPLPLNPGAANVEAKAPSCPGFDRPSGRGGTAPLCAGQDAGVRGARAKGVTPVRGWIQLACARAPVPRCAG